MARVFVAVWPSPEVVAGLAALDRPEVPGLRWTTPDQWHVTLRFLGRVADPAVVATALRTAGGQATEAAVGPVTGRFGQQVLHVPVTGLDELAAATVAATAHVGEPPEDRRFTGHLTLARAGRRAGVDLRPLAGRPLAGRWAVEEVTVVVSHLHHGGARYEVVDRVALARGTGGAGTR